MDYAPFIGTLGIVMAVTWLLAAFLAWRWTWLLGWLKGSVITGLLALGGLLGAIASDMAYWQQADEGRAMAHVSFTAPEGGNPVATIKIAGSTHSHTLEVNGDFLDLGFQALHWKGLFSRAGLSYRLVTARSHFDAIENAGGWAAASPKSQALSFTTGLIDVWKAASTYPLLAGIVDPERLDVNYIPIQDGVLFAVIFRDGKLVLEAQNRAAENTSAL